METILTKIKNKTFTNPSTKETIKYDQYALKVEDLGIYAKIEMPKNPVQKKLWKEYLDKFVDEEKDAEELEKE